MTTTEPLDIAVARVSPEGPRAASPKIRAAAVIGLVVVAAAPALAHTTRQVFEGVDLNSPIAYVPFVPLVALAAAAQRWRGVPSESPHVAHRSADWIVFVGLAVTALAVGHGLPLAFTTETLAWRADLAAVAPVAAAAVVALLGLRMLWRLRTPLWVLTLMSPALYRPVVEVIRSVTASTTNWFVAGMSQVLPFVEGSSGVASGREVDISTGGGIVTLRVVEVCAGNGAVLAGLFMSIAMWVLSVGPRRRKAVWAAVCVGACWVGNLVRLTALFTATAVAGETAATGWFHEAVGIVCVAAAILVSLRAASRLGLAPRPQGTPSPHFVSMLPRVGIRAAVVVALFGALMLSVVGSATGRFDLMAGRSGQPTTSAASTLSVWSSGSGPSGLSVVRGESVAWAAEYFGPGAEWDTYLVRRDGSSSVIGVDVISTSQGTTLDTYGVTACLGFHGWRMDQNRVVEIPGGRRAEEIVYTVRGDAAQEQARTPDGDTRSVAVFSWRQRTGEGRVERISLQQPQPVGSASTAAVEELAMVIIGAMDGGGSR